MHNEVELPTWRSGAKCSCGKTYETPEALNKHRAEVLGIATTGMIEWLVEVVGYPYDIPFNEPIPEEWREPLVRYWYERDHKDDPSVSIQDIRAGIAEEGHWT
jgi:hypothetical protein